MARAQKRSLPEDMDDLRDDTEEMADDTQAYVGRKAREARRTAQDLYENTTMEEVAEKAGRMARDAYDRADELESRMENHIRKHPLVATGGAFVVGLIISRFFRS